MDNQKVIQAKQELLRLESEQNELILKYKSRQKMKVFSLIAIPVVLLISLILVNYKETYDGYSDKPYEALGLIILLFVTPIAITFSIIGFIKAKKLKQPLKDIADKIMQIKNELIVLENS